MSRLYEMDLEVKGLKLDRVDAVIEACCEEWPFELDDFAVIMDELSCTGQSHLTGGEGTNDFADRLARAIWTANRGYCDVEVIATYLEDLPFETLVRNRGSFDAWQKEAQP